MTYTTRLFEILLFWQKILILNFLMYNSKYKATFLTSQENVDLYFLT